MKVKFTFNVFSESLASYFESVGLCIYKDAFRFSKFKITVLNVFRICVIKNTPFITN